jgi:hypothetical protein
MASGEAFGASGRGRNAEAFLYYGIHDALET